ncbi:MAG: glycosyltransferase [Chitinophagales bacterium]
MKNDASYRISIIMPTYNRASYIVETIDSVRSQTYQNWELIIIDDGSDDNTEELVRQITDHRIQFYKAGRIAINGKIKNIGIEKAKGDLIAFIDSDDLWAETKLEKQVKGLQEFPDAGFSLTGGFNFRNINRPIDFFYKEQEGMRYDNIFIPIFKSQISTTTPSLIFRKECLNIVGGFDETKPFSDVDFILKLAGHFKAIILYEPLLYRRLHDSNDSGTNWVNGYQQGISMIRLHKRKLPSDIVREALFKLYINFGEDCLLHKERKKAIKKFFNAWLNKPASIVPLKKTAKAVLQALINYDNETINISAKSWIKNKPPKRILAIRLQAIGDVTITLPYLQHLRHSLPATTKLDFFTRKECADIPENIFLFDRVISIGGRRNFKKQLLHTIVWVPRLLLRRYDVVIDLQNNNLSEMIRKIIQPKAWSVFDRFSPIAAGERTRLAVEAVGLGKNGINSDFLFKKDFDSAGMLKKNGWNGASELVVLNPAAAFPTRNWPLENYVSFARLWLDQFPNTQFLVIGTSFISSRVDYLKEKLDEQMISIINQTTPSQAFAILRYAKFVLTEDSGLMHMAWVSGIPTLALFGGTRSDWSRPLGEHSFFLDSSDLPCGNCMLETCRYGDVHCLTRYSPEMVFAYSRQLIKNAGEVNSQKVPL